MVMAKSKVSYEESRRKRLEENKQRMEALNLTKLAQSLRNSSPLKLSPMKSVKKPRTVEKQVVVVRRSSRVANMPVPVYKEVVIERVIIPRRTSKHRDLSNRVYASDDARTNALERADKLLSELEPEYPAFVKTMLQSHVTGGFWLGLPVHFCKKNLSKRDEMMTLIDEDGEEYKTVYLARKTGLSGGWKGFSVAHDLVDGDALIFQLIRPSAFKVFIMRVNSP
ncbi:B3 domain-containing protein At5g42700 [Humulus lupulus]|uniref:B3 domain-containing protein At5g42700 n=1 Tax=Humulus lupulus TaxID=3486 RepID=UPI002B40D360|nr:B3 domain-containing protein At5g42700 [Humulus lupulus]